MINRNAVYQRVVCHPAQVRYQSTVVGEWISRLKQAPERRSTDRIDRERASQLSRTLPWRAKTPSSNTLPKGHHFVYFQPRVDLEDLGEDGTSTEYNAPAPYLRRMWSAGSLEFEPSEDLPIDCQVEETVSINNVEFKANMIFVHQQRDVKKVGATKPAIREIRTHVFRPVVYAPPTSARPSERGKDAKEKAVWIPPADPDQVVKVLPTAPLLFRFSALTLNAHRIHYDKEWAVEKEGHTDLVVHGPFSALSLIELAVKQIGEKGQLARFEYRATSPMYVNREIRFHVKQGAGENDTQLELWASQDGKIGMRAKAIMSKS